MGINQSIEQYLNRSTEAAPLAAFRILFGVMMFLSIVRFWANGWIEKLYITPTYHFSYYGFEWVQPLGYWTYLIFAICGISAVMVALGWRYQMAIVTFFLSFTYIELMDKTTYLNHYYFISLVSFLLIWLPAHAYYSIDAKNNPSIAFQKVPQWTVDAIKLMLGIVYFYAGLAKLNSDWLIHGMPLKIWLPSLYDLPVLGDLYQKTWFIYFFSWGGAIYDLCIPFLLLYRRTRWLAFGLVVFFHVLTRIMFPIGMFPYIMIVSSTIFFDPSLHQKALNWISGRLKIDKAMFDNGRTLSTRMLGKLRVWGLAIFFAIQLLFPFRYTLYPGELFWTEEGFRFSWRVMLIEKAGYVNFKVVDQDSGDTFFVDNQEFLTAFQEKQMATQADFILEFAHFLGDYYHAQGLKNIQIFAESYAALNGRRSRPYIDPTVDLLQQKESFRHKTWILPFDDDIKGL